MIDQWTFRFDGYDPQDEGRRESLCTVGNGYLATRGAAPESTADDVHYPGTYVAGVYNRLDSRIAGEVIDEESLVNVTNWLPVDFRIDGGAWFDIDRVHVLDYRQELDLRRAVLTRHFRFRDDEGRTTAVTQRRFASMDVRHACALEVTVTPENWSGRLELRSALDGTVENTQVPRYRHFASKHVELVDAREVSPDTLLVETVTSRSGIHVAAAARSLLRCGDDTVPAERHVVRDGAWIGHHLSFDVDAGQEMTLDKTVTVFTDRDPAASSPADQAARWLDRLGSFDELLRGHTLAWRQLWDRFAIELEDAEQPLQIVNLHLLHILQAVSPNSVDLDVGVPARGLHGEAYRGHILWDQLFVLPVLHLRTPLLARSLLLYRYRRLDEAREAARTAGLAGAMYPWRSGSDGREATPAFQLNPRSGRWMPDSTRRQRHIGAAVAYNVWQYYQATDDHEFLAEYGAEMILEIARFWASIAEYDHGLDRYVIRGVMGPDEFHTGYLDAVTEGIDNNAYTNVMAVWVLCRALETLSVLPRHTAQGLQDRLDLGPEELDRWSDISHKMLVPFHGDGIISQFEGYGDLEELDWDSYRRRYGNIQRLDLVLEAEDDTANRYKVSKQADVLMLFYLLSADELRSLFERLGYELPPEMIPHNIDYYADRTSQGSTLSIVVHAWVLARAQRERAMEFFVHALCADVADIQGGTTPEGIHLAAMAGSVDVLQRCYSGLELRGDRLILNPYWPEHLGDLSFSVHYRGQPLSLRIHGKGVEVSAEAGGVCRPVEVSCRGELAVLEPGARARFPL